MSNLYAAALGLAWHRRRGRGGTRGALEAAALARDFCPRQEQSLTLAASEDWSRAVVLADSGCAGLAEEGALAFKEICRRDSNHYHMLDCRHGPMVQICPDTLVIALLSKGDRKLQAALLGDVAAKTSHLLVLDHADGGDKLPGGAYACRTAARRTPRRSSACTASSSSATATRWAGESIRQPRGA